MYFLKFCGDCNIVFIYVCVQARTECHNLFTAPYLLSAVFHAVDLMYGNSIETTETFSGMIEGFFFHVSPCVLFVDYQCLRATWYEGC